MMFYLEWEVATFGHIGPADFPKGLYPFSEWKVKKNSHVSVCVQMLAILTSVQSPDDLGL